MADHPYPFDLVLFDLDGTLVETAAEIAAAVNRALADHGRAAIDRALIERWIGHGTRELLFRAVAWSEGKAVEEVRAWRGFADLEAAFSRHYLALCGTDSRLYPNTEATLVELRRRGVKLAVVTNKEGRYVAPLLAAHGLGGSFDRVIAGDTLGVKKPDPATVLDCLQHFGVSAQRTLLVGDSSVDVATARNAGVQVWAVPYGYNMGEPVELSQPDRTVADLSALLAP